jgi:outer membrane lipoprotein-sorting protein
MTKLLSMAMPLVFLAAGSTVGADRFEQIKKNFEKADCAHFAFLSLLESEIFERVDTAQGTAYIANDGRYRVTIGGDEYLYDSHLLYSYSRENNQVTVETVDTLSKASEQITFVTHLDDYYMTKAIVPDKEYRLDRKSKTAENIPDSMLVFLESDSLKLKSIEYYDINDELNRIIFTEQNTLPACDSTIFQPDFPDSVETINLW